MATCRFTLPFICALIWALPAQAADFYVDPESGSMGNDGSEAEPWSTLEEVIAANLLGSTVEAGDTVHLRSGYHGDPAIDSGSYAPAITIAADAGETPTIRRLRVSNASGLVFRGLSISPSHAPTYEKTTLVTVGNGTSDVVVEGCDVFSEEDVTGWTADDWINLASSGFQVGGSDNVIRGNTVRNVRFGISVGGDHAHIVRNTVDGFSADGLRGLGDYDVFEYNVVKNCYVGSGQGDDNHDDGFQSWSVGEGGVGTGEVVGVVLRGNLILNYEDENHPFRATMQGVGCFDGTFVDWVIENNVVITDHWHGITLLGARNSRVVNNTVIDVNDTTPGPPWISIDDHKNGTPPEGCLVRNNLATDFRNAGTGVTEDHNLVIDDPLGLFVDPAAHDLRLLANATDAIDQGSADQAPTIDRDRIPRPQGAGIDLGAYEWHTADVMPPGDGGVGAGGTSSDGGVNTDGGGNGGSGSGAGGSATGTGGAASGAGGAASGAGGSSSGGGAAAQLDGGADAVTSGGSEDDGGCGCRTAPDRSGGGAARSALALAAVLAARTRRRRSR